MSHVSFMRGLSGRLLFLGVLPAIIAIAAIVALSVAAQRRSLSRGEERVLAASAAGAAAELRVRIERWNDIAQTMAQAQMQGMFGQRKAGSEFTRSLVESFSPQIVGAFIAYERDADGQDAASLKSGDSGPGTLDAAGRFVPYWHADADSSGGALSVAVRPRIGMETMAFYQAPKAQLASLGKPEPVVTEPFEKGGILMVSHACPIVIGGKFAGVVGVDRSLTTLATIADSIRSRVGADVFILSPQGRFVAATADGDAIAGGASLAMRPLSETKFGGLAARWMSVTSGGDVDLFEEIDPVLAEPCVYAVERTSAEGWVVVARRSKAEIMHEADIAMFRHVTIGTVLMIAGAGTMLLIARGISTRVKGAAAAADRIARGDLTIQVPDSANTDETGSLMRSMRSMDANLNTLVGNVKQAGIRLNSTATEIAATSKQQEASTATFGAASNQIAAAVKEITATGQDLVRTMESVNRIGQETAALAAAGKTGLQGMEAVMQELSQGTRSIADKLGAISERSQKITAVITTIAKVADQTNILSINAAIEAEKAGEIGAGFLVIAREIRRLADQTASATLDIEQIVQQMQTAVSAGVMEMDRFSQQVRHGVRDVATAGTQLTEIITRVNDSTESFTQVNESMQSQSEGVQQISEAMASLVANANQTAQSAHEFGRAAGDLQSAIAVLREAVARFKLRE
jgi:methyl-accepting chemotaxis protein